MKRLLSIFLICAMVITMVPAVGFAADTGKAIQPDIQRIPATWNI